MKPLLLATVLALSSLCANAGPSPAAQGAESEARGDFARLLALVESAPVRPHLRHRRSLDAHVQALAAAGRFQALGVTPAQGEALVRAWFRRQGLDPAGLVRRAEPVGPEGRAPSQPPAGWQPGREFDRLQAVLLRWPGGSSNLRDEYATMVRTIVSAGADARIWVDTERQRSEAESYLQSSGVPLARVQWTVEDTDSIWLRDYGPNFIYGDGDWGVVDFHYYSSRPRDDDTPRVVAAAQGKLVVDRERRAQRVYTEGGNINTDGLGAVIYSTRTYQRNPGVRRSKVDERILSAFNASQGIVLKDPLLDSTGHVDMFSKLVSPDTILVAQYDADEVDHAVLEANAAQLAASSNGAGQPLNVVRIRQPDVYFEDVVYPVVRTYTNSVIVNDHVIVPVYGIADDAQALAVYAALFPGKTIVPLDATQIIGSGGAWHCVTMEFGVP